MANSDLLNTARQHKTELMERLFGVSAQSVQEEQTAMISALPAGSNVVGIGFGTKMTSAGVVHSDLAVRVYVRVKLPRRSLSPGEEVPLEINGVPTDVVAVGDITALVRPTPCGVSVGHPNITAGTLGCLLRLADAPDDNPYILSNNHVMANSNLAQIGDPILQPGSIDGGTANDAIAELRDFEPIQFDNRSNFIDAAIARVMNANDVLPEIVDIGRVQQPPIEAALYQSVRKRGRTTLQTVGNIVDLSADIRVVVGNQIANFENQLAIIGMGQLFSSGGDSGSLIVDALNRQPVGLLFAGGRDVTFANPIAAVLSRFQAEII
uniref:S1 family peptidase n=1 Tax=Oculatella sp. LEGE 06141 TaxID=1828648 RepID=UPI001D13A041|nr:S1 family peptidase [Oculatella sp. LEGE 06141]